jgi:hypothetical protein
MSDKPSLAVLVDGVPLPDDEARALWTRFSEHMDEHRGDMAGFAKLCGYVSVAPEVRRGQPVLVVQTTNAPAAKPAPPQQQRPTGRGQGSAGKRRRR